MFYSDDFEEWLAKRVSRGTVTMYGNVVRNFEARYGEVENATDEQIETFVRNGLERRQGVKSSCIVRRAALLMLRKFMRKEQGAEWGGVLHDIDLPRPAHRVPECLTQREIMQILEAAKDVSERAMWEVLYCCGLRCAELCNLRLGDVNLDDMELTVIGKGDKQRVCYLSLSAVEYLKRHIEECGISGADSLLFPAKMGGRIYDSGIYRKFKMCAKRAGITKNVHPHLMRHSFATKLLKNGADLMTIKDMMGHSSISTTQVYLTVENDRARSAFRKAFGTQDRTTREDNGKDEEN